jgi:starch synthase
MVYADEITTVSPSYAEEIQTAYYGERLDGLLRARRGQLKGILNGIDVGEYDPANDPLIYAPFSAQSPAAKAENKAGLQRELSLAVDPSAPLIGIVTRLSHQKGLDLIDYVIRELMDEDIQLAVLGMGDAKYTDLFSWAEGAFPGQVAARFAMDEDMAHLAYAGSDITVMPSLFEPCGLSQLIGMSYGSVPVVRCTGGLLPNQLQRHC